MDENEKKALSNKAILALYREFNEAPPMDSPAYRAYVRGIDDITTINFSFIVAFAPRPKQNDKKQK